MIRISYFVVTLLLTLMVGCEPNSIGGSVRVANLSNNDIYQVHLVYGGNSLGFGLLGHNRDRKSVSYATVLGGISFSKKVNELSIVWNEGINRYSTSISVKTFIAQAEGAGSISLLYAGEGEWIIRFYDGPLASDRVLSEFRVLNAISRPLVVGNWELQEILVPFPKPLSEVNILSSTLSFSENGKLHELLELDNSQPKIVLGTYSTSNDTVNVQSIDGEQLWRGHLLFRPHDVMQIMRANRSVYVYKKAKNGSKTTSVVRSRRPMRLDHPLFSDDECVK